MDRGTSDRNLVIALNLLPGFGPRSFIKARERFPDFAGLAAADETCLLELGITGEQAAALRSSDLAAAAAAESARAEALGARLVTWFEEGYPAMLRYIHDPPPVLYLKGPLDLKTAACVAVVGSRKPSPYGLTAAETIGRDLAASGFNVVSGMARGIDTAAHRGALAGGGRTTAVFGCGLDIIYPPENRRLAEKIAQRGSLLSEFPLGVTPDRYTFPRRNRIVSGLSLAVIIVEAGEQSGAFITAEFALEQGREVFAVPGPISSGTSAGCHRLIKEGARLYERLDDLTEEISAFLTHKAVAGAAPDKAPSARLTAEEQGLLGLLGGETLFLDEITGRSGLPPQLISSIMLSLELKGQVRRFPGQRYLRLPP